MLRRQHLRRGRLRQEEVRFRSRGLLRVPASQERGTSRPIGTLCGQNTKLQRPSGERDVWISREANVHLNL